MTLQRDLEPGGGMRTTMVGAALAALVSSAALAQVPETTTTPETTATPTAAPVETPKPVKESVRVFGYLQPAMRYSPDTEPTSDFIVNNARIGAQGEIVPGVSYSVLGQWKPPGTAFAGPRLLDAWVQTTRFGQSIRFGSFKTPFGWEQPHQASRLPLLERSLIGTTLAVPSGNAATQAPGNSRDLGVSLFGELPLGGTLRIEHAFTAFNGTQTGTPEDNDFKDGIGRVGIAWGKSPASFYQKSRFRAGVSGGRYHFQRPDPNPINPPPYREGSTRIGVDVELENRFLLLVAEAVQAEVEYEPLAGGPAIPDITQQGVYGLAAVKLFHGKIELAGRYEHLDADVDIDGNHAIRFLTGVNYLPSPEARQSMRISAHYRRTLEPLDTWQGVLWAQIGF